VRLIITYSTEAVLIKGEPLGVITQWVNMHGRSLGWLDEAAIAEKNSASLKFKV